MRNKQAPILPLFFFLLVIFSACTTPPPSSGSSGSAWSVNAGSPGNPAVQATLAARHSQDAAATYESVQAATRAAAQATEAARVQTTATAQAAIASAATSTSAAATNTAVAATATAENLSVQGTQIALVAVQTQNAIQAAATGTHQAASAHAEMTAQAVHMANAQMLQDAERQRLAAQQQRQEVFNTALPFLLGLFGVAVVILTGLFAYLMIRSRNPVYHVEHMGNKIAIIPTANGSYAPLPALTGNNNGTLALPAPAATSASATPSTINLPPPQRSPRASWRMFISHSDPAIVPLGVNEASGQPIFLNRMQNPHLLIAGTTGAGKTASGLVPFVAGNWGNQAHVVIINGRGSDFAPFASQENITLWPAMRPLALIDPLADFLTLLVEEMFRRDGVLAQYGARNWSELPARNSAPAHSASAHSAPAHSGQPGELLVAIDEFLTIIGAATEAAELARLSRDRETAKRMAYQATVMWLRLIALTNEGRKYGIYLAVTMTDPSRDAIGEHGMRLRRQMATLGFRMNSAASSRSFLDVSRADGLPSGSVGLANGRFVYNINGETGTAIGFYPDQTELGHFFDAHSVTPNPLPPTLAGAITTLKSNAMRNGNTILPSTVHAPGVHPNLAQPQVSHTLPVSLPYPSATTAMPTTQEPRCVQAAADGHSLRPYLAGLRSLNAAGSLLSDVSGRPSGQFLRERLKPALLWLHENENNSDAQRLLSRFNDEQ